MTSFKEYFSQVIWPDLQPYFERLQARKPATKEDSNIGGRHYGQQLWEHLEEKNQVRNIIANLTWTGPVANTPLTQNMTLKFVQICVRD